MKKLLLSLLMLGMYVSSPAQNRQHSKNIQGLKPLPNDRPVPVMDVSVSGDELPVKKNFTATLPTRNKNSKISSTMQTIGNTTYDLQSNGSSIASRFYNSGDDLGIAWTYSQDLAGTYPDRGTGVNRSTDNGVTWGPPPTSKIESKRQGFGSIDRIGTGEVVISHAAGAPLTLWSHATVGASWDSSLIPFPSAGYPLWNSMKVGGNNGTSIHMVTATAPVAQTPAGSLFNGMDGAMVYYRSPDGGLTWDIQAIQLPESDVSAASPYLNFRANSYAIDAKGDNVAVVSGSVAAEWSLWKSTDNGTNWNRIAVMPFPKPKFDQVTMDTDTNADGIGDTLLCSDGAVSVVIDNNGMAHCFSGAVLVLEEPGAGALGLFLSTNALLYWNESMGTNPPVVIAESVDLNGTGALEFGAGLGGRYGNDGICSMPSAGVDAFNNIYVAYSTLKDGTTDGGSPDLSFRNVWAQASPDNGATWLAPYNLFNDDFTEEVYPCAARDVDNPGCFHVMYQSDGAPGTTVPPNGVGTIGNNDIVYTCVDPNADLLIPTGINQINSELFGISVSPNPASEFATINYTLEKAGAVGIDIVDVLGQSVYNNEITMVKGANNISISLKGYTAGVYFVNSSINGIIYTNKFVVR